MASVRSGPPPGAPPVGLPDAAGGEGGPAGPDGAPPDAGAIGRNGWMVQRSA